MILLWIILVLSAMLFSPLFLPKRSLLRYFAAFYSYGFLCFLFLITFTYINFKCPRHGKNYRESHLFGKLFNYIVGIKYSIKNPERLQQRQKYILVMNHQSAIDLAVLTQVWKFVDNPAVVHKKELEISILPLIQLMLWCIGAISLDRTNRDQAIAQLTEMANKHFNDGNEKETKFLCIYPEGKRTNGDSKLQPFKKGAFHLAVDLKVPIVPLVVSPYYFLKDNTYFDSGKVIAQVLEPVDTEHLSKNDVQQLTTEVWEKMNDAFISLGKEVCEADKSKKT